jgi:Ni/Co efflux regulator RcnB
MNKISAVAVALTLLGSSGAIAQQHNNAGRESAGNGQQQIESQNRNGQDANEHGTQEQAHGDNQQGRTQDRKDDQGANRYQSQGNNEVRDNPHWSRGDRLSDEYRGNSHVVQDWKGNHLRQPPRGYHWVQANNQYVLAAVATGVIADIIMGNQANRRPR